MGTPVWEAVQSLATAAAQAWTPENLDRCDPYLVWADATTRPPEAGDPLSIAVLVELSAAADYQGLIDRLNQGETNLDALSFVPNGFEMRAATRFVTGLVSRAGLQRLVDEVVQRRIECFSLQDARRGTEGAALQAWREYVNAGPVRIRADAKGKSRSSAARSATGTYLGIIDDGLPVLRAREATRSVDRPAHFWDQGWQAPESMGKPLPVPAEDDPFWDIAWEIRQRAAPAASTEAEAGGKSEAELVARGFLYGRCLKPLSPAVAGRLADRGGYARLGYFVPAPRRSHGAAVLGLLAPWLSAARRPVRWPEAVSGLAMVQLPTRTVSDTSGGSLAMRVLDGLRFVLWQEAADRGTDPQARPTVVNVSYGVHAGPHDGTSMFERAVLELLDAHPHLHLVLPAGNAARAGCHARRELARQGEAADQATFRLAVLPDNGRDTFVELWLPAGARVALDIRPPGSKAVHRVVEGEARVQAEASAADPRRPDRVSFGAVYAPRVAQGQNGTMVLVAIGSTARLGERLDPRRGLNQRRRVEVAGQAGLWELTVHNISGPAFAVDAWIERGDAAPDESAGSRQAFFPDAVDTARSGSTPEGTLSGIATMTHPRLHVVGAMRADGSLSDYSAAGPARAPAVRTGPNVVAPADASRNLPGLRTLGFVEGAVDRINGTSAACAVHARDLARRLASKLSDQPPPPIKPQPDIDRTIDKRPRADPAHRGEAVRKRLPFDVDL